MSAKAWKYLHVVLAVFWLISFGVVMLFGWQSSVPLLVFISIYANFVGHVSAAQAARVEDDMNGDD